MFSRFHRIKVARGGQCLQFGARASLPELPGVHWVIWHASQLLMFIQHV